MKIKLSETVVCSMPPKLKERAKHFSPAGRAKKHYLACRSHQKTLSRLQVAQKKKKKKLSRLQVAPKRKKESFSPAVRSRKTFLACKSRQKTLIASKESHLAGTQDNSTYGTMRIRWLLL